MNGADRRLVLQVVVQGKLAGRLQLHWRVIGLAGAHLLGHIGNAGQVVLVLDGLLFAQPDDLVQQSRHLGEVGRVGQLLLQDLAADVVLDRLGDRLFVALHLAQALCNRVGDAGLDDQVQQADAVEGRNLPRGLRLDVGVDEVAHVRLVRLQVQRLAGGLADDLAQVQVVLLQRLERVDLRGRVTRRFQVISQVGIRTHQGHHSLVKRHAMRLAGLQVVGDFGVAAEVVDVLQVALGRRHRLAQESQGFHGILQAFAAGLQTVLDQDFRVVAPRAVGQFGGVDGDGLLYFLEQVLVVNDVAKLLVIAVEPVGAADGLEQAMVLHGLVDVEVGAGRGIKARQQLVHHDQELHLGGRLDEAVLRLLLVGLGLGLARLGHHVRQQRGVGVEDELLVALGVGAGLFLADVRGLRVVGGHHRAPALEHRLAEQHEVLAGLVDAGGHQDGVAAFARQPGLHGEVEHDVGHHAVHAGA